MPPLFISVLHDSLPSMLPFLKKGINGHPTAPVLSFCCGCLVVRFLLLAVKDMSVDRCYWISLEAFLCLLVFVPCLDLNLLLSFELEG